MAGTRTYAERVAASFTEDWARKYRELDAQAFEDGGAGNHYGQIVQGISASFGRPIDVLDAGCGTGRYFHCLKRVRRLVGVDISASMLQLARDPIGRELLDVQTIDLMCGDALSLDLPHAAFDFIYSIGVLGEYSPLDASTLGRFRDLLAPLGVLFITAVDSGSRVSVPEADAPSIVRRLVRKSFPRLPQRLRRLLNRRFSPFYVTRAQLQSAFLACGFSEISLTEFVHTSGWLGTHWDCRARL
jgi:SAM-dependent methyltransferase